MSATATVTCFVYQPVKVGGAVKLKAKKYEKKGMAIETALEYFEAKLAKWTEIVAAGGKLDILIPNMAFRGYVSTGTSVYYEIVAEGAK